jgi:hypothetical protein
MSDRTNKLSRIETIDSFTTLLPDASNEIRIELITINQEVPKIGTQISSVVQIAQETSIQPSYNDASAAFLSNGEAFVRAYIAQTANLATLAEDWVWPIDFTQYSIPVTGINGQTSYTITAPGSDLRILNTTINATPYQPILKFQSDGSTVGGIWSGWDTSVSQMYSQTNQATFNLNIPLFSIFSTFPSASYTTTTSSLNLSWNDGTNNFSRNLVYDSSTVLDIKNAINSITGLIATGSPIYDSFFAEAFKLASGSLSVFSSPIFMGLRDSIVTYQTISDRQLNARIAVATDRKNFLDTTRVPYLLARESQIGTDLASEEILRTSTGDPGDLYTWANNRFNRRNGCYAKLKQIEQQIATNQAALKINKSFL